MNKKSKMGGKCSPFTDLYLKLKFIPETSEPNTATGQSCIWCNMKCHIPVQSTSVWDLILGYFIYNPTHYLFTYLKILWRLACIEADLKCPRWTAGFSGSPSRRKICPSDSFSSGRSRLKERKKCKRQNFLITPLKWQNWA